MNGQKKVLVKQSLEFVSLHCICTAPELTSAFTPGHIKRLVTRRWVACIPDMCSELKIA